MENVYFKLPEKIRCANCAKDFKNDQIKKEDLGEGRLALFCIECNCFLGIVEISTNLVSKKS
ncbi:MAG: hypothetical protein QXL51_00270 [Candidatus Aenigmatarchaeota archaeon]